MKPRSPAVPAARTERGQRTRQALMDAALTLMQGGRSFNSLSMREVAQASGVVPSGFYRHFRSIQALGLALVDDCGRALRPQLREARTGAVSAKNIIRDSVLIYQKFVEDHPRYFLVASGERHGGSPEIRAAIREEIARFVGEMAEDVHRLGLLPNASLPATHMICDLVVNTMLSAASDILDLAKSPTRQREDKLERYVHQVRLIFLGARAWRDKSQAAGKPARSGAAAT